MSNYTMVQVEEFRAAIRYKGLSDVGYLYSNGPDDSYSFEAKPRFRYDSECMMYVGLRLKAINVES